MTRAEFIEIVRAHRRGGSFLPLFLGVTGCEKELVKMLPASVPTDWSYVVSGIYALYRQDKDGSIPAICRRDILQLLTRDDVFSIWCGYNAAFSFLWNEGEGTAPFSITGDGLLEQVRTALAANRQKLRRSRIWQGNNAEDGLWAQIAGSAAALERRYGIQLI